MALVSPVLSPEDKMKTKRSEGDSICDDDDIDDGDCVEMCPAFMAGHKCRYDGCESVFAKNRKMGENVIDVGVVIIKIFITS